MKQKCATCSFEWTGCPNCKNPNPDQEMEYSPENYLLGKLARPATRMSLNNEKPEDMKYNK